MVLMVKKKEVVLPLLIRNGTYRTTVSNIKTFANDYGERIGFEFTITGSQFDGEKITRSTASQINKKSKLTEVIQGILGRELTGKELQDGFALKDLINKECNILVLQAKSQTGVVYPNVERVFNTC
jgi:hypothetical protein